MQTGAKKLVMKREILSYSMDRLRLAAEKIIKIEKEFYSVNQMKLNTEDIDELSGI